MEEDQEGIAAEMGGLLQDTAKMMCRGNDAMKRGDREAKEAHVYNIATSLKDRSFLDFFMKHVRKNDIPAGSQYLPKYGFVSPCG